MRTLLLEDFEDVAWRVVSNYLDRGGVEGDEFVPSDVIVGDTTVTKRVRDIDGLPMRLLLRIDWSAPVFDHEYDYFRPTVHDWELLEPTELVRLVTLEDPNDLDSTLQDYFISEERDVTTTALQSVGDELQHEI